MKPDINTRKAIELLVNSFYKKVTTDDCIGPIFIKIAKVNWDTHLARMYDFWESILLGGMNYKGNPMLRHLELSKKTTLSQEHFDRWLALWHNTIDTHFSGEKANDAKQRGVNIAGLMLYKINHHA